MKPVLMIGSLLMAAAAGAAACYLIINEVKGGGNGAVTCPGNGACPGQNRGDYYHGMAFPKALRTSGKLALCDGRNDPAPCVEGYAGLMIDISKIDWGIQRCEAGDGTCRTNHDAIYCDPVSTTNPTKKCAIKPGS